MRMENRICRCGAEYEVSEWGIVGLGECDNCREPAPPQNWVTDSLFNELNRISLDQMRQVFTTRQQFYHYSTGPLVGDTYTISTMRNND